MKSSSKRVLNASVSTVKPTLRASDPGPPDVSKCSTLPRIDDNLAHLVSDLSSISYLSLRCLNLGLVSDGGGNLFNDTHFASLAQSLFVGGWRLAYVSKVP